MHDSDDIPEELLDSLFGDAEDPSGWTSLFIVLVPEDDSSDPSGRALQSTRDDASDLADQYATETRIDDTEPLSPDAIPMDAREIEASAESVMPELSEEMPAINLRAREAREAALDSAREAGEALRVAILAHIKLARKRLGEEFGRFHTWCLSQYARCAQAYAAGNEWCHNNPLGMAGITIAIGVIITAIAS